MGGEHDVGSPVPTPPLSALVSFAFCIFCVFFCFIPTQTFAALVFPDIGALMVALVYTLFGFGVVVSPTLMKRYDPGNLVFIGSALYIPLAISVCIESKAMLVIGACCCGAGASILWNGVGVVLTNLSDQETRGRRAGIFSILNRLNFTANFILGACLSAGYDRSFLFIFIITFGVVGTLGLGLHAKFVSQPIACAKATALAEKHTGADQTTIFANARTALRKFKHSRFRPYLFTNYTVYGLAKGFVYSTVGVWGAEAGGTGSLGYIVGLYGLLLVVSAAINGALFDACCKQRAKSKIFLFLIPVTMAWAGMYLSFYARTCPRDISSLWMFYLSSALIGAGNGGVEAMGYAYTSYVFPNDSATAFAAKLYAEVFGQIIGFLLPALFRNHLTTYVVFFSIHFVIDLLNYADALRRHCQRNGTPAVELPAAVVVQI